MSIDWITFIHVVQNLGPDPFCLKIKLSLCTDLADNGKIMCIRKSAKKKKKISEILPDIH